MVNSIRFVQNLFLIMIFRILANFKAMSAVALWNNMLQPVGKKATTIDIGEDILCPTEEHPYFYTIKNSN